jgi:MFS family permease
VDLTPARTAGPTRATGRGFTLVAAVFSFWLIGLIDKFSFGTIVADRSFLADLGLSGHATAIGALTSAAVLAQAVGLGVFGWATDRYGPRRCAMVGVTGWVLSCLLAAVAPSVAVLGVSRVLLGFCEGFTWPVSNALTARWFPMGRRARARALWMAATCVGPGVSGYLTSSLLGPLSWRGVFWALGAASLVICMPMVMWLVKDSPSGRIAHPPGADSGFQNPFTVARTRRFWLVTLAAAGTSIAVWALASWLPSYLLIARHSSPGAFRFYVLVAYGLGLLIMLGYSHVVDRLRRRSVWLAAAFWTCAACLLLIGLVPGAPYLLLIAVVIAVVYGITQLHVQGFQDQMTEVGLVGTENGLMNALSNLGAGLVPFAMGGLIDLSGGGYDAAFLLLFALLAISGLAALLLYRRGF